MNVFFITGTSGSGKSTLTKLLQKKLSKSFFAVHDFDEKGVPADAEYWLEQATKNAQQGKSTVICGVTVPTEVINESRKLDVGLRFGFMKINDDVIKQRLQACAWGEQVIQDNTNWAHYLENDVKKQKNHKIVDCSMSTPEQISDEFVTWILGESALTSQAHDKALLEDFDDLWSLGDPSSIEKAFRKLLPQVQVLHDKSIYLQLLSQIALTQALQKQFDEAHATLDEAEKLLTSEQHCARVRILLERGRVFQQSEKIAQALDYFEKSFELSAQYKLDYHMINAAHMIAIVVDQIDEKITWNQRALALTESTKDMRARLWFGPLYNNLGQNYMDAKQFDKALSAYQKALEYREKENYPANVRFAQWAVGRALRALGWFDEALNIQNKLLQEYDKIAQSGNFDVPMEMFTLTRGWVYEEIAELYDAKAKCFACLAYDDLSSDAMFRTTEPKRLERLKQLQR